MGRRPRKVDPTASAAALFGAKVRKHREANGWTQEQLGEKVYCTGDLISKIELAVRTPSQQLATEFDRLFGTGEYFQELWHLVNKETILGSPARSRSSASTKAPTPSTSKIMSVDSWSKRPHRWKNAKCGSI